MIAVYSSHPSAPLALRARSAAFDPASFGALDALRLPGMRGSIHLIPRDTAPLVFAMLPEAPARAAARLRWFGLTAERYAELREQVLAAAAEPRTAKELAAATAAGEELKGVIGTLTREGVLVRVGAGSLRSNALRYRAERVPAADPDESLGWLAGEYLRAFGPARAEDLAWWTGAGADRVGAALATVETEGLEGGFLLRLGDRRAFEDATPLGDTVDVLGKWDAYQMGYPAGGRGRFADADVVERCYDFRGDGRPLVLAGGRAIAAWESRFKGRRMEVDLELFESPGPKLRAAIGAEFEDVGALLGAGAVEVREVDAAT